MFGLRKTFGTALTVIAFLGLATLASFIYTNDQKNKENPSDITENVFVQKGKALLGFLFTTSEGVAEANLEKNIGPGKTMADFVRKINWQGLLQGATTTSESVDSENGGAGDSGDPGNSVDSSEPTSFWLELLKAAKNDFSSNGDQSVNPAEIVDGIAGESFFDYQKTEKGAELIFRGKSGEEYKLPLPFSFLSSSQNN